MKKRLNKKGLSTIVSTLLILLLVFVAVAILWVVVRNVIQQGTEQVSLGKFTLDLKIEKVTVSGSSLNVKVRRNVGAGEFTGLSFIIDDGDNTEIYEVKNITMAEYQERTFPVPLVDLNAANVEKVEVAPIFTLSSGKEVTGDVKDTYEISKTTIPGTTPQCTLDSECNDNNNGTIDTCPSGTCVNTDITECSDNDFFCPPGCTSSNDNWCVDCTTPSECNDNDPSTADSCVSGTCQNTAITTCTDGDDTCPTGCYSGNDDDCVNECALDSHCDDGNSSTSDTCVGGTCQNTELTCTGDSTQSCTITNGAGQQTRTCTDGVWSSWGTCTVVSCNSGYEISGNECVSTGGECSNIITNGDFSSGDSSWIKYSDGSATFDASSGVGVFSISAPGTNVQLYQFNVALYANTNYVLSFDAYSNTGHDTDVHLLKHETPFTNYGLDDTVDLTTSSQHFEVPFTTTGFTGTVTDGRFRFWMRDYDAAGDIYYFDNVEIREVYGDGSCDGA